MELNRHDDTCPVFGLLFHLAENQQGLISATTQAGYVDKALMPSCATQEAPDYTRVIEHMSDPASSGSASRIKEQISAFIEWARDTGFYWGGDIFCLSSALDVIRRHQRTGDECNTARGGCNECR